MSIIGEMWERYYFDLEKSIPIKLERFAEWLADNGFRQISPNLWCMIQDSSHVNRGAAIYYNTQQLVNKFLKEISNVSKHK